MHHFDIIGGKGGGGEPNQTFNPYKRTEDREYRLEIHKSV